MMTVEEKLCLYLEQNYETFLERWSNIIIVSKDDPYKEDVVENGRQMAQLVILILQEKNDPNLLKQLAEKVATERVDAKVNIGEFVYNVNLGRSEIFKHLHESQIPLAELQPVINKINQYFDQFIYFAVQKYTELKDQVLEEKKTLLEQTHLDRLTLLGQLSASFVHEFRNPLTSISGFIKLLQRENPSLKYIDVISHELEQLNYQVSQFLLLSKKGVIGKEKETFSLSQLLKEIQMFLYPSIADHNVLIETREEHTYCVLGYRDELRQVLLNILINSIDALKELESNRRIHINVYLNDGELVIDIHNNGPQIPSEVMWTIFEPFVSNKKFGTGIGLFVCKQIVEKHGGTISCTSSSERTSFSIYLPYSSE